MKKIILICCFLAFALGAMGQGITINVYNVGITNGKYRITKNGVDFLTSGIGYGQKVVNSDGGSQKTYVVYWGTLDDPVANHQAGSYLSAVSGPMIQVDCPLPIVAQQSNCVDHITLYNRSTQTQYYELYRGGVPLGYWVTVSAGASPTFDVPNPDCDVAGVSARLITDITSSQLNDGYSQNVQGGSLVSGGLNGNSGPDVGVGSTTSFPPTVGSPGGAGGGTPSVTSVGGAAIPQYTNSITGTNIAINYTNAAAANTNALNSGTYQQGNNALYTATVEGSRAIVDAVNRNGGNTLFAISNLSSSVSSGNNTLNTNLNAIRGSIGAGNEILTNIDLNTRPLHEDLTNGFAQLYGALTNGVGGTNDLSGLTNQPPSVSVPSALDAKGSGESALSGPLESVQGMIDGVPEPEASSGGAPINQSINAGAGYVFQIQPSTSLFSGLFSLVHGMWMFVLALGYAGKIVHELYKLFHSMISTQGTKIQQLEFTILGTGGNAAGVLLAPLVIVAVLAIWALFLGLAYSTITGVIDWSALMTTVSNNPIASMDSGAKHLLLSTFPFDLAVALVCAFLTFRLSMMKIAMTMAAAKRFVIGG